MRLGVDFGGTKIEGALLDSQGEIRTRLRVPNPGDYEGAVRAVGELTARIEQEAGAGAKTIGLAIPGSLSEVTGMVRNSNSTWLNGKPFLQDLKSLLGRPVRIENDANCFALSEATDGAAAGARVVFGCIFGTGCGGGLVVDGKIVEGANGVAGEWGHLPLPWMRPDEAPVQDWCGRWNCLEQWLSGTGFKRWSGMSGGEAAERAANGDAAALAALDALSDRIARALAIVIDIADPHVIVFGGGISNIDWLYPAVQGKLIAYAFSDKIDTKVVKNKHGDSSGVRGAAWLFEPGGAESAHLQ
ncbi:MAG TPA: ROK family protein [Terricaulis sp.]|nr:ROK family protein [Terricaulis sp.]